MARLAEQLIALATMSLADLGPEWERVHRAPAPQIAADLLRLGIAYRLQERALGGLSRATAGALRKRAGQTRAGEGARPGTRLVRSWNGRTISVLVEEDGFVWEDRRYRSLSAIAREVTGAAWSGPRFFGLTGATGRG